MRINHEDTYYQQQALVAAISTIGELQTAALKFAKADKPELVKIRQINKAIAKFSEAVELISKGKSGTAKIKAGKQLIQESLSQED